jgi:hypothetical protein
MALYARLNPDTNLPEVRDFSVDPGRKNWVPLVVQVQPAFDAATQVVVPNAITFSETQALQTWTVRAKTADELAADAATAARASLTARIADISAQRAVDRTTWDAYTANQLRAEQWRDRQALLQSMDDVLKILRRTF